MDTLQGMINLLDLGRVEPRHAQHTRAKRGEENEEEGHRDGAVLEGMG